MAEGGQVPSRSILGGSDADCEFTCNPCGEDNVREEAICYCPECQEYLCERCSRHHGRQKVSKSHKLVETSDVKRGNAVVKATKCRYHGDRNIEMYCKEHDMVYCTMCIATNHRYCSGVVRIEDINHSHVYYDEIQRLQSDIRDLQVQLAEADKCKHKNLERLEEQIKNALEAIENMEQELINRIRKISAQSAATVKKHYLDVKNELESDVNDIGNATVDIERSNKKLQMFVDMDSKQQFVHMKLIKDSVCSGKKMVGDKSNESKDLSFKRGIDLDNLVKNTTSFGKVDIKITANKMTREYKIKSEKEINVKMSHDSDSCYITDICELPDGTILLTDYNNKKVKRLDSNYIIRDHCDLDAEPLGICCIGQKEVAVKMYNNKVQFITVNKAMTKSRQIDIEDGACYGMAYWDDSLWMSTGSGVNIYSTSGALLKSIEKCVDGQNIFKEGTWHMSATRDVMIVTDGSDGAVCLNRDGVVQQEIRDGKLNCCNGVTVSGDGTVFLSGWNSNKIMMFSLDGICHGELVIEPKGLINPLSLCLDKQRNNLIVSFYSSDKIHILMLN